MLKFTLEISSSRMCFFETRSTRIRPFALSFYVSLRRSLQDGINLDCKVVGDCKPLPSVDDHVMIDRVLECAQPATGYGMINATTFLNHKVDTKLMDQA